MSPENRRCPKCGNPTLIFMVKSQTWQCISVESFNLENIPPSAAVVTHFETPCGYTEKYDSLTAILRGMVFYLTDIVNNSEKDATSKRLASSRDEIADILADKDTQNILREQIEKN